MIVVGPNREEHKKNQYEKGIMEQRSSGQGAYSQSRGLGLNTTGWLQVQHILPRSIS